MMIRFSSISLSGWGRGAFTRLSSESEEWMEWQTEHNKPQPNSTGSQKAENCINLLPWFKRRRTKLSQLFLVISILFLSLQTNTPFLWETDRVFNQSGSYWRAADVINTVAATRWPAPWTAHISLLYWSGDAQRERADFKMGGFVRLWFHLLRGVCLCTCFSARAERLGVPSCSYSHGWARHHACADPNKSSSLTTLSVSAPFKQMHCDQSEQRRPQLRVWTYLAAAIQVTFTHTLDHFNKAPWDWIWYSQYGAMLYTWFEPGLSGIQWSEHL